MKSRNKPLITVLTAVLAFGASAAQAGHDHGYHDRAKVVSSTPIYERVNEPHRECWTEYETRRVQASSNNTGGAILGAVVGGLVGSTVGKGDGRVAAAAVGAATGAVIGDRWNDGSNYRHVERPVERCRKVNSFHQEIVGYDVVYRYNGRHYSTRLPYDPGKWIDLKVDFAVAEGSHHGPWHESRSRW